MKYILYTGAVWTINIATGNRLRSCSPDLIDSCPTVSGQTSAVDGCRGYAANVECSLDNIGQESALLYVQYQPWHKYDK